MAEFHILFLGAGKRVSLLERFVHTAAVMGLHLRLYSCERDNGFYPISHLAQILPGPDFLAPEFISWLEQTTVRHRIQLIVPNMDAATVGLSRYAARHPRTEKCWPVVSEPSICQAMHDKCQAREYFISAGLPVPPATPEQYPKIAKPRFGYGARGIRMIRSAKEMQSLAGDSCVVEDFLSAVRETTVDLYFSPGKGLMGYVLRDRLEVSDGEVMVCRTRPPRPEEVRIIERVAELGRWEGCITLQYLSDRELRVYLVEINPRFGGGCTCAFEAGLDMSQYLLAEARGIDFAPPAKLKTLHMTRARRDFFREC